jgi:hypothetical protein
MSNITIFEEQSNLPTVRRESRRMDRMSSGGGGTTLRRIALSNNRMFTRVVGGVPIGKAVSGTLDVVIVDWLAEPSRKFYATAYDKGAKFTLPDCWSNDGVVPEAGAKGKQANSCAPCPKNVKGSGFNGKNKACRYERRLAVLIAGDPSGDVYQISIPSASLFGDDDGGVYGFEAYRKFLFASNEAMDTVVTQLNYYPTDTIKLGFKPMRHLTAVEVGLVDAAQDDPDTERCTKLTVSPGGGSTVAIAAAPAKVAIAAPTASVNPFGDDDDDDDDDGKEAAPVKRASKPKAVAAVKSELSSVLEEWGSDEEE